MHKINSARHQKRTDQHSSAHRSQFFVFFKKLIEIVLFKVVENALVVNFSHSLLLARPAGGIVAAHFLAQAAKWRAEHGWDCWGQAMIGSAVEACQSRKPSVGSWAWTTMTDDSPMTVRAHSGLASVAQGASLRTHQRRTANSMPKQSVPIGSMVLVYMLT